MIRKHGWKALAVLLLCYTFTAGLLIPLRPGIISVEPRTAEVGRPLNLEISGYNTTYPEEGTIRAWLKLDSVHILAARAVTRNSDRDLQITFAIPPHLPAADEAMPASLIINDPVNGAHVLPDAVFFRQGETDLAAGRAAWRKDEMRGLQLATGIHFPFRAVLKETIRNTYFHVALWFAMLFLFIAGLYHSIIYLRRREEAADIRAAVFTETGIFFGILGLVTGAVWARFTWGAFWSWDVKQNMTAIALLIYLAYFVLRNSFEDEEQRARLSAAYNIFAFALLIPLIYIIPRLTDSLHPGAGGNPAFGSEDLDNTMRMVFYPAIIGWTLLGWWVSRLRSRLRIIEEKYLSE